MAKMGGGDGKDGDSKDGVDGESNGGESIGGVVVIEPVHIVFCYLQHKCTGTSPYMEASVMAAIVAV